MMGFECAEDIGQKRSRKQTGKVEMPEVCENLTNTFSKTTFKYGKLQNIVFLLFLVKCIKA